jgi:hypothetical protein
MIRRYKTEQSNSLIEVPDTLSPEDDLKR